MDATVRYSYEAAIRASGLLVCMPNSNMNSLKTNQYFSDFNVHTWGEVDLVSVCLK